MNHLAALKRSVYQGTQPGALSPSALPAVRASLDRGISELSEVLCPAAMGCLAESMAGARLTVVFSLMEMGLAHHSVACPLAAPLSVFAIPVEGSGSILASIRSGEEVPRLNVWSWLSMAELGAESEACREYFEDGARTAMSMFGDDAPAAMAEALLDGEPEAWIGTEAVPMRRRVTAACGKWIASMESEGPTGLGQLVSELMDSTSAYVRMLRACRTAAEAWMRLRSAAWNHSAASGDWFDGGYPTAAAGAFLRAYGGVVELLGGRAEGLLLATIVATSVGRHSGLTYLSWEDSAMSGAPEVSVILAAQRATGQGLTAADYRIRQLLAHELAHLVWRRHLGDGQRKAFEAEWSLALATGCLPSSYAQESPEEGFCEHVAARLALGWGRAYRQRLRGELVRHDPSSMELAALDGLDSYAGRDHTAMEAAAGCFLPGCPPEDR